MKYLKCVPAKIDRFFAHDLKDVHFPGDDAYEELVPRLADLGAVFNELKGYGSEDAVQAIHILPQEREATKVEEGGIVELDVVNFTITLLFNNRRPFIFFFDLPYSEAEEYWVDEAVSTFISQGTSHLLRKAERKGYNEGRKAQSN